jgi:hypothetical protein
MESAGARGSPACSPASRHRSVHPRRVGRLPGRVRRGLVRRQGHLRRRRVPAGARRQAAREPRPQPRPARGRPRPRRPRQRRAAVRGLSVRATRWTSSRRHRWTRGDWQITAWLLPRVPGGDGRPGRQPDLALSRWKIFDNLRRSLVPVALLALLGLGWATAREPGRDRRPCWSLAILVVPGLLAAATAPGAPTRTSSRCASTSARSSRARARSCGARRSPWRSCPTTRSSAISAIVPHARRGCCSPGAGCSSGAPPATPSAARTDLGGIYAFMWIAPIAAIAATGRPRHLRSRRAAGGRPRFSRSRGRSRRRWPGGSAGRMRPAAPGSPPPTCCSCAGSLVGPGASSRPSSPPRTTHLPPDNYQEDPPQGVAHRTSPTNIGLALTANLAAYDFGYVRRGRAAGQRTRGRSPRWTGCSATAATFTTGTTPAPSSRCCRSTSRPSTAATSPGHLLTLAPACAS